MEHCWQCGQPIPPGGMDFCNSRCFGLYHTNTNEEPKPEHDEHLEPEGMIDYDHEDRVAYWSERNEINRRQS